MTMVRIGIRNLWRSKLRLVLVAALIGTPFFLLLVMQSIGDAVQRQTEILKHNVNNTLQLRARGSMGHVNMVGNEDILPQDALAKVKGVEHVAKVEPYLLAMTPTEGHNFAMVVGVAPGDTRRLESHGEAGNPKILAGRDLTDADRGKPVAIVGQGVAKWAGIKPEALGRAALTLDLKHTHPVIFALDRAPVTFTVVGIYASGYVFGDMQLFTPLDTFREVYGVPEGISWLYVRADSADNLPAVERQLRAMLGDIADIISPTTVAEFQATATAAVQRLANGGTVLSAVLMVLVVYFVMLLVVRERAREIGTLKAIGASDAGIVASFLTEAVLLCAVGAIAGALLFALWGGALAQLVFGLGVGPFLPAQYGSLATTLSLAPRFDPSTLAVLVVASVVAALGGSAWGIRQIIRLSPMEAMRNE
ncbi:ABC transporter permease [Aromatoleum toluclasticum]|uniref:ABC transporter permease n=1 Tax=Aromatoleum toluclasticum TaxID=92003 RepID=UPI0003627905|nr:ABC transporter permease [Aromatoleum toluclasticum]